MLIQSIDNNTILFLGLAVIVILLIIWVIRLEIKLRRLLIGKNATSLEDSIVNVGKDIKDVHIFIEEMRNYMKTVEERLKRSIQTVETVRFNPFKGTGSGGNQSFSTAFVSQKGDGVILTGMYARDRISFFSKPLKNFTSEFELTEEEKDSLEKAKQALTVLK